MDKKNTVIGVVLLVAAMASFVLSSRLAPSPAPGKPVENPILPTATAPVEAPSAGTAAVTTAPGTSPAAAAVPAEYVTLSNDFIEVKFTNHGGAIDTVGLKKHQAEQGKPALYTLNAQQAAPALSFRDFPGADRTVAYSLVSKSATDVVYRATTDQLEITRTYSIAKAPNRDDYQIRHETTFRNLTDKAVVLPRAILNVGTALPLNEHDIGQYLNVGYYDGDNFEHTERGSLEGGGFFSSFGLGNKHDLPFIDQVATTQWVSVKNQFFTMILTSDQPGTGIRIERVKLATLLPTEDRRAYGVTGYATYELKPLAAGASTTFGANYFAGPKEYKRLSNPVVFKHREEKVMQFSSGFGKIFFSGFFAPLLMTIMTWVHSIVPNWGWAIVITTLLLKIVFLPLTLAASKSAKRMAKLQPLMAAMREKHKDNPQKIQAETLRLFKENKVNPVGGCIPILITIPFFIAFFTMLQSASDLRFASFLWVHDLSAPDTVARIWGFPLNIMPLLMGATMIIQMRLTPTPTVDNAQATMMKIMPWIFTIFCYTFASGLALYSTINGLFTIGQQMIINRMPEPELPATAGTTTVAGKAPMKNVTPKKKK
ncbi:membrane protein insertase YidC [Oleiharenicola lentus]|uniref:membrane protein insertase YidC n=1 Tax=Oleiharenicola lentus TaxID=2508720 RepID=UPI003F6676DB